MKYPILNERKLAVMIGISSIIMHDFFDHTAFDYTIEDELRILENGDTRREIVANEN